MTREGWRDKIKALTGRMEGEGAGLGERKGRKLKRVVGGLYSITVPCTH